MKCEGSEISEYLQISKLARHSSMDASGRPKTPGSEVKDNL